MALKTGSTAIEFLKGGRGLAYDVVAYAGREKVVLIPPVLVVDEGTALTPGQETAVLVPVPGLRPNADVKWVRATLRISAETADRRPSTLHVTEGDAGERT